jgi:hypothetical protein
MRGMKLKKTGRVMRRARWTSGSIIKTGTEKIMTFEIFSFCAETVTIRFMVKRKRGENAQ